MRRIQYVCRRRKETTDEDIGRIIAVAAKHNARKDISGFLISMNDIFFQLIEGDDGVINELYFEYIRTDLRHTDVICLKHETDISVNG